MQQDDKSAISFTAFVARLPQKGMPVVIDANERQRRALAQDHQLVSVERLRVDLLVAPWKRNGVKVTGNVEADITQECIVTLEPVQARIDEPVEGLFLPADSKLGRHGFEGGGEILIDADGPDSPETFDGDAIDVGALAEQFFALAIDPYPRKPGATLDAAVDADANGPANPLQEKLRQLTRKT